MYSIVLTDGKIVNINVTEVEYNRSERMVVFLNDRRVIARINMDNVAGWVETDYKESEEE